MNNDNDNGNDDDNDMILKPQGQRQVVDRYLQKHNDDPATSVRLRLALFLSTPEPPMNNHK